MGNGRPYFLKGLKTPQKTFQNPKNGGKHPKRKTPLKREKLSRGF